MSADDRHQDDLARLGRETHPAVRRAYVQLLSDAELRVQERDLRIEDLTEERDHYQRLTRDLVAVGAQHVRQLKQARRRIKELEKLAGMTRRPPGVK